MLSAAVVISAQNFKLSEMMLSVIAFSILATQENNCFDFTATIRKNTMFSKTAQSSLTV